MHMRCTSFLLSMIRKITKPCWLPSKTRASSLAANHLTRRSFRILGLFCINAEKKENLSSHTHRSPIDMFLNWFAKNSVRFISTTSLGLGCVCIRTNAYRVYCVRKVSSGEEEMFLTSCNCAVLYSTVLFLFLLNCRPHFCSISALLYCTSTT